LSSTLSNSLALQVPNCFFYEKDLTFGETLEKPKTKKQKKQSLFLVEQKLSTIFSDVA
jgi:hypothetical protein